MLLCIFGLLLPGSKKMKICNVKKNKYNVAMDPGIKFNKSNKQKIKNPVNQIIKVFWGHDLN